jgi:hypothetical protein
MRWIVVLGLASALALSASSVSAAPLSSSACGNSAYTYAGFSAARRSYGVAATVTALRAPDVQGGHVAGWIGVGGPVQGPDGSDEWLQVGMSAFVGDEADVYYELSLPGQSPQYTKIMDVQPFEPHRLAVVEVPGHRSVWQIWVDQHRVGAPIFLPRSHGRWAPIATAESWNGGASVCNAYSYRFANVSSARRPGGSWHPFRRGYRFQDPGYGLKVWRSSFTALARF